MSLVRQLLTATRRLAPGALALFIAAVPLSPGAAYAASAVPRSLEGLGTPTYGYASPKPANPGCYGFKTASQGADLAMGGSSYQRGFQLSTGQYCGGVWTWAWHLGGKYRTFKAYVGLGAGDTSPADLEFVNDSGARLPFKADGHKVKSTTLIAGLPTTISLTVKAKMNLIIETTTSGATINFANDSLAIA